MKKILLSAILMAGPVNLCSSQRAPSPQPKRPSAFTMKCINWLSLNRLSLAASVAIRAETPVPPRLQEDADDKALIGLFNQAQRELGISEVDRLPINIIRDHIQLPGDLVPFACTGKTSIDIYKNNIIPYSYGFKRMAALHEATHHKYKDFYFESALYTMGSLGFPLPSLPVTATLWALAYKKIPSRTVRFAAYGAAPFAALLGTGLVVGGIAYGIVKSHRNLKEYRADLEAIKHANCFQCLEECNMHNDRPLEYMTKKEMEPFIAQYKTKNTLCSWHKINKDHAEQFKSKKLTPPALL